MPTERLRGRRALVTGGASGIGAASARRLAAEGAAVAVLDARLDAALAVAAELERAGAKATGLLCDVGDESSVLSATERAASFLGGIDAVVAAAGISRAGDAHLLTVDEWDAVIRVNLTGVFLTVKHSLEHLMTAGGATIVTIGSVASLVAAGRACSYDAAKGGVLQLTRAIAVEYVERGVRANCVCPGLVRTSLAATSTELHGSSPSGRHVEHSSRTTVPISRHADPAEIAAVVAFLTSDDSSFVTGAAIAVDGGYTAV